MPRGVDQREGDVDHPLEVVDRDLLVGRVDVRHPVREVDALEAALVEDVRVGGAPRERVRRLVAGALRASDGEPDRADRPAGSGSRCTTSSSPSRPRTPPARPRTRSPRASPARGRRAFASSCERASAENVHHSGTMLRAVPPSIEPTFAVVSSSTRPSRRSAIARAAAAIAERPSSGYMPAWDARPWKRTCIACACGAPRMTSPIGAAWSKT